MKGWYSAYEEKTSIVWGAYLNDREEIESLT